MIVRCEQQPCTNEVNVSDVINPNEVTELYEVIIPELETEGWGVLQDPENLYIYCPDHKNVAEAGKILLETINKPSNRPGNRIFPDER